MNFKRLLNLMRGSLTYLSPSLNTVTNLDFFKLLLCSQLNFQKNFAVIVKLIYFRYIINSI
jgi:hypothetical protein